MQSIASRFAHFREHAARQQEGWRGKPGEPKGAHDCPSPRRKAVGLSRPRPFPSRHAPRLRVCRTRRLRFLQVAPKLQQPSCRALTAAADGEKNGRAVGWRNRYSIWRSVGLKEGADTDTKRVVDLRE